MRCWEQTYLHQMACWEGWSQDSRSRRRDGSVSITSLVTANDEHSWGATCCSSLMTYAPMGEAPPPAKCENLRRQVACSIVKPWNAMPPEPSKKVSFSLLHRGHLIDPIMARSYMATQWLRDAWKMDEEAMNIIDLDDPHQYTILDTTDEQLHRSGITRQGSWLRSGDLWLDLKQVINDEEAWRHSLRTLLKTATRRQVEMRRPKKFQSLTLVDEEKSVHA